jgi:hypothetical protein
MDKFPRRLLVTSCSDRKVPSTQALPAMHLYHGPASRVLRKYLREGGGAGLEICIPSAKYGIIGGNEKLPKDNGELRIMNAEWEKRGPAEWHSQFIILNSQLSRAAVEAIKPATEVVDMV